MKCSREMEKCCSRYFFYEYDTREKSKLHGNRKHVVPRKCFLLTNFIIQLSLIYFIAMSIMEMFHKVHVKRHGWGHYHSLAKVGNNETDESPWRNHDNCFGSSVHNLWNGSCLVKP